MKNHLKVSLHNHTTFSDGALTPTEFLNGALNNNYDIVAITDHNNTLAFDRLDKLNFNLKKINKHTIEILKNNKRLFILKGCEPTCKTNYGKCHIGAIGLEKKPTYLADLKESLQNLKKQKCLIIANHPFDPFLKISIKDLLKFRTYFDAIEIDGLYPFPINLYVNLHTKRFCKKNKIPLISSPDSHNKQSYFNQNYTLVESEGFNKEEIVNFLKKQMKNGKFRNSESIWNFHSWHHLIKNGLFSKTKSYNYD